MFLLVKNIDGENIIIGTAQKNAVAGADIIVYEILDADYSHDMIYSRLDSFDEDV